jgi:putative ABC transport system permease protein
MSWTRFFRRRYWDEERARELEAYLAIETDENIARGMSPEEARYAAQRKLGNPTLIREEIYHMNTLGWLETLWSDLRYGARMLRKNPSFTAVSVIMLALGIGVTTAIFTAANDFLLRPLPFSNSERLVVVTQYSSKTDQIWGTGQPLDVDPPTYKYWREQNHVFEEMAAWSEMTHQVNLTGSEGPERVRAMQVTAEFFHVLGVNPVLGRTFSPAEDRPGGTRVAVISHALWQARYGGNSGILGKTMILDGKDYTVIGVLPAGFRFSTAPEDVWAPLAASLTEGHGGFYLTAIARLKPGVTLTQARADMDAMTSQLAQQFPEWNQNLRVAVKSLRDRYTRDLHPALLALLGAAALVLLIACANLANLLLARGTGRHREIAVRRALGASRPRVIRQMLIESSVLALLGGSVGLLLAFAGARTFYAALPADWQPLTRGGIDASVLIFASVTSLLTVFLFGTAPAWSATGLDLNASLKEGWRSPVAGLRRRSFRAMAVAGEVATAAILLTGTGLLTKSFARLSAVNLGFNSENVLTVSLARTNKGVDAFYGKVIERITALPQVRAAGAINIPPLADGSWGQDIYIEGRPPRPRGDDIWATHRTVSLGYFRAMGIPLLAGRSFVATDQDKPVAVISKTMARRYWPGEDAVGRRFGISCPDGKCNWRTVVGVVGDVKELGATEKPFTSMYFLDTMNDMTLVVRAVQNPTNLIADVRGIIRSTDTDQTIGSTRTMENIVSDSVAPRRLTMVISGLFAALALLLAMVGLYGVIAYSVEQRRHEIGVRMALGARPQDILKMIVGQGALFAAVGLGLGLAGALAVTRLIREMLFSVEPADPAVFAVVFLTTAAFSLFATYWPARRAIKVDPMVALRYE